MLRDALLSEFAERLGLPTLAPNSHGVIVLDIGTLGQLGLEAVGPHHERVLVSFSQRLEQQLEPGTICSLLEESQPGANRFPVHFGLAGSNALIASICLDDQDVTVETLHAASETLVDLFERLGRELRFAASPA